MRDSKAAKTRSAAETRTTAIHEAGHTVLLIALGLAFSGVSIIPDVRGGSAGRVYLAQWDRAADLRTLPREAVYLRHAMVSYAGAEAVRQLIPTHPNPDSGASQDKRDAAEFIRHHIGSDAVSIDLLISLVKRRCALLVEHYQPEIQALVWRACWKRN
jgi:ATP-dependent Zn protease